MSQRKVDLILIGAVVVVLLLILARVGHAHNPKTHQQDDLSKAASEKYGICCTGDDYIRIETWEPTATGWRIMVKGKWMDVQRTAKVSNMPNPDGEAKAWINGYTDDNGVGHYYVRCFMEGTLS